MVWLGPRFGRRVLIMVHCPAAVCSTTEMTSLIVAAKGFRMKAFELALVPAWCLTCACCYSQSTESNNAARTTAGIPSRWESIYGALRHESALLTNRSLAEPLSSAKWLGTEEQRRQQWLQMLGLHPLPPKSELKVTVTGTLARGDYVVRAALFDSVDCE